MTVDQGESSLKIAIVGAGLVGTFASIALSSLPNVKVTTFEKTPNVREAGAWISLTESGIEVLSKFIPIDELHSITASPGEDQICRYFDWKSEKLLNDPRSITFRNDRRFAGSKTHRSALLKLLLKYVPEGTIHYGRNITSVNLNNDDNKPSITYEYDGQSIEEKYDLIVAADGIYSKIRHQIYPESKLVSKGVVAYRNLIHEDLVKHIKGYKLEEGSFAFRKPNEIAFLSPVGLKQYSVVLIVPEPKETIEKFQWDKQIDEKEFQRIKDRYKDWPAPVHEVLEASPYLNAFPLMSAPWLEHLSYNDNLVFIGDAAHPTSGAYGSGAAFGFGDTWALFRSLQESSSNGWKRKYAALNKLSLTEDELEPDSFNLKVGLFLFDETRRYFLQDVYEQMSRDGLNYQYIERATNEDEKLERIITVSNSSSWMTENNVELEFQRVLSKNIHLLYKD